MKKIFLVEISPSVPNVGTSIVMPRSDILTIASILAEKSNYDVTFLFEPNIGIIDHNRIISACPHYLFLNGLTTTSIENELLVSRLRKMTEEPFSVIVGGEHATMFPEHSKRYADYIVLNEGDETVITLLSSLEENDQIKRDNKLSKIPGIIYKDSVGSWHKNNEVQRVRNIDYRYDFSIFASSRNAVTRFPVMQLPLQTSRGCKYNCSFCSWISLFGKGGYYVRPIEDVLHDIKYAMEYTGIKNFMVVDNLFAGNQEYTEELLHRILATFEYHPKKPEFNVLCRADQFAGSDNVFPDKFLRLMRKAGVTIVTLGLESVSNDTLNRMKKHSSISLYKTAAQRLHQYNFNIAATFVAGYGQDTYKDILNIAYFATSLGCFTILIYCYAITPKIFDARQPPYLRIPGLPERFCNGHSVVTFPRQMLPSTLHKAVFDATMKFYEKRESQKRLMGRIFRQIGKGMRPYYEALKRIETEVLLPEGLYVFNGKNGYILQEEELQALADDCEHYKNFIKKLENIFDPIRYPSNIPII